MASNLSKVYNDQYLSENQEWRRIGAITKARNIIDLFPDDLRNIKVLDLGSGDGSVIKILSEDKKLSKVLLYSLEISESGIEKIKGKSVTNLVECKKFDGYNIPYEDDFFDVLLCSHVIEHVENPRILLREIKRVSKFQILEIPIDFSFKCDEKVNHFLSYGHINIFSPQLFNFLLLSEGFIIDQKLNRFYSNQTYDMVYIGKTFKRLIRHIRKFIWSCIPLLMVYKPDTYTVLSRSGGKGLEIFVDN